MHNFSSLPQITRSQYQNGLMASRLDSTPQSPESSQSMTGLNESGPPAIAITDIARQRVDSAHLENGPDETTLLLINEQNSPHLGNNSQLENSV